MLFTVWVLALLVWSAVDAIRLHHAPIDRYRRFIYGAAAGWALIPATTGDFVWLLATIPAAAVIAPLMVRRREKERSH